MSREPRFPNERTTKGQQPAGRTPPTVFPKASRKTRYAPGTKIRTVVVRGSFTGKGGMRRQVNGGEPFTLVGDQNYEAWQNQARRYGLELEVLKTEVQR